jgi:hypothetical protein
MPALRKTAPAVRSARFWLDLTNRSRRISSSCIAMPSSGPDDRAMRVGSQTVAVLAVSRKIREALPDTLENKVIGRDEAMSPSPHTYTCVWAWTARAAGRAKPHRVVPRNLAILCSVLALWDCVSRPGQVCPASATGSRTCRAASARSDYPRGPGIEAAGPCEAEAGVRHQREVPLASCPRAPRSSASVPARRRTSRR